MANLIIQERESHIQRLEGELNVLKKREKIIKSCGFQHRVPLDFFQNSPEEFDSQIYSLFNKQIITSDEYASYICKKNDSSTSVLETLYNALFGIN